MKKISLFVLLLLALTNLSAQNKKVKKDNRFAPQIETIIDAFKTKKVDKLNQLLIKGYTINRIPKGIEPMALPQIFQQMPSFNNYVVTDVIALKENKKVLITFSLKEQKMTANIVINKLGKITELNILGDTEMN